MNNDTPPNGIQVSGDGYFVIIAERLARIETTLESIRRDRDDMQKDRDDHEARLRSVEKWKYMLPPTLVVAAVSGVISIYGQIGR
jgi:hypothetical protein